MTKESIIKLPARVMNISGGKRVKLHGKDDISQFNLFHQSISLAFYIKLKHPKLLKILILTSLITSLPSISF